MLRVETSDKYDQALRSTDTYNIDFEVWNDVTFTWHEYSYFIVYFPDTFEKFPTVGLTAPNTDTGSHSFSLETYKAAWNRTASDTSTYLLKTTTFNAEGTWNATINQLGNALTLTIEEGTVTDETLDNVVELKTSIPSGSDN